VTGAASAGGREACRGRLGQAIRKADADATLVFGPPKHDYKPSCRVALPGVAASGYNPST